MGLLSGITGGIGSMLGMGGSDFDPMQGVDWSNYSSDVGNIRNIANSPVTGLDAGGQAATDLANTVYGNQVDQLGNQASSNMATNFANLSRYGASGGSQERMANSNMRNQLMGQQNLGQTNMSNLANIANQNISQQQDFRNTALMGLPQMSLAPAQMQTQANAANQQANAATSSGIGKLLGAGVGAAFGGPMGMAVGSSLGGLLG